MGDYVAPASMVITQSAVAEGGALLPKGDLSSWLEDKAMEEGGEDSWIRPSQLGLLRVDFSPPGLCGLAIGYVGVQTSQSTFRLQGFVSLVKRSISSLQGGPQMVKIYVYRGPDGGLCGACVHGHHPVRGSRGGRTPSEDPF